MKLTELLPLYTPRHRYSVVRPLAELVSTQPADINDQGHVVGFSKGYYSANPEPEFRALLWIDGDPVAVHESPNSCIATRINNRGEVLVVERDAPVSGATKSFLLFKQAAGTIVDLATVIPDLVWVYDLNDAGRILALGRVASTSDLELFIHDLDSGARTVLPPFQSGWAIRWVDDQGALGVTDDSGRRTYQPVGLDNQGRAVVLRQLSQQDVNQFEVHWLPSGGSWQQADIPTCGFAWLGRGGLILPKIESSSHATDAFWYDLNAVAPVLIAIPPATDPGTVPGLTNRGAYAANDGGVIALRDGVVGGWFPSTSDTRTGRTTNLSSEFVAAGLKPKYAQGINNAGQVICVAYRSAPPAGPNRGWVLSPDPLARRLPELLVRILFGVIQDGGGVVWPPGGPPVPAGPLAWDSLTAAQQDVLVHTAISRLATLVNDPDARRRIEQGSAEAIAEAARRVGKPR